jgi:acyl carrier protein
MRRMATLEAPGGRPTPEQIAGELRRELAELSDGKLAADEIDESGHLFDYGYVDSLTAVTFLAQIEDRYGVRIDDVDLVERLNTLRAIAKHLHERA